MRDLPGSADDLLGEAEILSYSERCRRLAEWGRALRGRPELRTILDDLMVRGQYERFTGVTLAASSEEVVVVARATRDPDPDIACYAIGLTARLGLPNDVLVQIVRDASMAVRAMAYRA